MKKILLTTLSCLTVALALAGGKPPVTVIVQVTDPQMGFYSDNRDMAYETDALTRAVEAINRLRPDAVVFTGDYVHNPASEEQWAEFLRIVSRIDHRIETLYVPGNHDMLFGGGSIDMTPYTEHLGADRFSVRVKGALLTGINSDYLKNETLGSAKEQQQLLWLKRSLERRKKHEVSLVFAHHPFFLDRIDEPENYSTLSPQRRQTYFDLFADTGVTAVFAGHRHDNAEASHEGIRMITTSAVGRQLGGAESGLRIITIRDGRVSHRYYPLDRLPVSRDALIE